MMGKRFMLTAALATLLASVGCLKNMCERHGYYPVQPAPACAPQCCVPVCPCAPAAGYPAASPNFSAPVPAPPPPATCPAGCMPAR